ncbi:MAG: TolC family protein [Leptospiraceae bacterium]|nr:TolC family protein [Leptospiraceae bacterium]
MYILTNLPAKVRPVAASTGKLSGALALSALACPRLRNKGANPDNGTVAARRGLLRFRLFSIALLLTALFANRAIDAEGPAPSGEDFSSEKSKQYRGSAFEEALWKQMRFHPSLAGDRLRHAAQQSRATYSDFVYPDPELSISRGSTDLNDTAIYPTNPVIRKGESYEIQVRQPIPFPGKLTSEANIQEYRAEQRGFEFQINRNRTISEFLGLLAQYHRVKGSLQLTRELAGAAAALEGIARARYGAGKGSLSDVSLARIQADSFREKAESLQGDLDAIKDQLLYFAASVEAPDQASSDKSREASSEPGSASHSSKERPGYEVQELLLEKAPFKRYLQEIENRTYRLDSLPMVARMRSMQKQAESADTLARLEYAPDLGVFAAYGKEDRNLIYPSGTGKQTTYKLGIQIKVPLWSGLSNHKNVEAANLERRAADLQRLDVEKQLRAQIDALDHRIRQGRKRESIFNQRLIPNAWTARRSSVLAYQSGSSDFTDVLQAWSAYYDVNLQKLALEEQLAVWVIARSEIANNFLTKESDHE